MTEPWEPPTEPYQQGGPPYGWRQDAPQPPAAPPYQDYYQPPAPPTRQRSSTPYLERDPYRELSAGNLEQEARQQSSGHRRAPDPYQANPQPYPDPYETPRQRSRETGEYRGSSRPVKRSNGLALAGAIACFIPVIGLILSLIGRARAKSLGGAGRVAGNVGIVLSLLFTGGTGFAVYKIANSTAADPACLSAEADARELATTLTTDEQALKSADDSGDKAKITTAGGKFTGDLQNLVAQLQDAEAKATHDDVRQAIRSLSADLSTVATGLHQVLSGDTSNESTFDQASNRLQGDGDAVDNLCGNLSNG